MSPTNGGTMQEQTREERVVLDEVRALQHNARETLRALEHLSGAVNTAVRERVEQRPFAMLGAAFVAGWILGGGLSMRMLALLAAAGARAAAANALRAAEGAARGEMPEGLPDR